MITQKENGSTSPKSQPAQDSANFTDTPERLQSSIAAITERCRAKFKPQNIPADLKAVKGWVVWKAKEKAKSQPGKFDKVPFYPSGSVRKGTQGDGRDRARLGTFEQALAAFNESPLPATGAYKPAIRRSNVLLPLPTLPSMATF